MSIPSDERIRRLEQELADLRSNHRRLALGAILLATILGGAFLWGRTVEVAHARPEAAQDTIRAHTVIASEVIVQDANGISRGTLMATDSSGSLLLGGWTDERALTEAGLINLCACNDGPGLSLFDATYVMRVHLSQDGMSLRDDAYQTRVMLGAQGSGYGFALHDAEGTVRALLGAGSSTMPDGGETTYPESSLLLTDPDGNVIWSAPR